PGPAVRIHAPRAPGALRATDPDGGHAAAPIHLDPRLPVHRVRRSPEPGHRVGAPQASDPRAGLCLAHRGDLFLLRHRPLLVRHHRGVPRGDADDGDGPAPLRHHRAPAPIHAHWAVTGRLVWVVGRGGFLGSYLERLAAQEVPGAVPWIPAAPRFSWNEPTRLALEIGDAARAFGETVRRRGGSWMALWCAAAGGVGTSPDALRQETSALRQLLGSLDAAVGRRSEVSPGV